MRDALGFCFSFTFLVIGVAILSEDVFNSGAAQTLQIVIGATFLCLGLFTAWFVLTKWKDRRKHYKKFRHG